MNIKVRDPLFLALALLVLFLLYIPAINGVPIWDDLSYWFNDPVIIGEYSFIQIWKDFSWPFSVSLQKILWQLMGPKYWFYHSFNLVLHFLNACLLYVIAQKLELPFRRWLFLFFLLHPCNVITVAWMIQLKTILCLFFALLAFYFILKAQDHKKWMILSWLAFLFSIFSKSSSLPLPIIFTAFLFLRGWRKDLLWLVPFFMMAFFGGNRVMKSPVTVGAVEKLQGPIQAIAAETGSKVVKDAPKIQPPPKPQLQSNTAPELQLPKWVIEIKTRTFNMLKTVRYYFWQTILPIRNQPVKGFNYDSPGVFEIIQVVFLILIMVLVGKSAQLFMMLSGFLMLMPFLGLVPAPYMNLTWVSDQHLYLAIPFFIFFWLALADRLKYSWKKYLPYPFLLAFGFLIINSSHYYKDEYTFFEASHEADLLNVPIAYNLAIIYLQKGEFNLALNITSTMMALAEVSNEVKFNKYFPHIFILHTRLQTIEEKR
jgi:hypothetical protein